MPMIIASSRKNTPKAMIESLSIPHYLLIVICRR
jgi:hypothetical protein